MEEYLNFGGRPISLTDVRVHELLLVLGWLEEAWREQVKVGSPWARPRFLRESAPVVVSTCVGLTRSAGTWILPGRSNVRFRQI